MKKTNKKNYFRLKYKCIVIGILVLFLFSCTLFVTPGEKVEIKNSSIDSGVGSSGIKEPEKPTQPPEVIGIQSVRLYKDDNILDFGGKDDNNEKSRDVYLDEELKLDERYETPVPYLEAYKLYNKETQKWYFEFYIKYQSLIGSDGKMDFNFIPTVINYDDRGSSLVKDVTLVDSTNSRRIESESISDDKVYSIDSTLFGYESKDDLLDDIKSQKKDIEENNKEHRIMLKSQTLSFKDIDKSIKEYDLRFRVVDFPFDQLSTDGLIWNVDSFKDASMEVSRYFYYWDYVRYSYIFNGSYEKFIDYSDIIDLSKRYLSVNSQYENINYGSVKLFRNEPTGISVFILDYFLNGVKYKAFFNLKTVLNDGENNFYRFNLIDKVKTFYANSFWARGFNVLFSYSFASIYNLERYNTNSSVFSSFSGVDDDGTHDIMLNTSDDVDFVLDIFNNEDTENHLNENMGGNNFDFNIVAPYFQYIPMIDSKIIKHESLHGYKESCGVTINLESCSDVLKDLNMPSSYRAPGFKVDERFDFFVWNLANGIYEKTYFTETDFKFYLPMNLDLLETDSFSTAFSLNSSAYDINNFSYSDKYLTSTVNKDKNYRLLVAETNYDEIMNKDNKNFKDLFVDGDISFASFKKYFIDNFKYSVYYMYPVSKLDSVLINGVSIDLNELNLYYKVSNEKVAPFSYKADILAYNVLDFDISKYIDKDTNKAVVEFVYKDKLIYNKYDLISNNLFFDVIAVNSDFDWVFDEKLSLTIYVRSKFNKYYENPDTLFFSYDTIDNSDLFVALRNNISNDLISIISNTDWWVRKYKQDPDDFFISHSYSLEKLISEQFDQSDVDHAQLFWNGGFYARNAARIKYFFNTEFAVAKPDFLNNYLEVFDEATKNDFKATRTMRYVIYNKGVDQLVKE